MDKQNFGVPADRKALIAYIDNLMAKMPYDLLRKLFITATVFAAKGEERNGE